MSNSSITSWFFFFSSRRRHTSSTRDWSSDVCSSDLLGPRRAARAGGARRGRLRVPPHRRRGARPPDPPAPGRRRAAPSLRPVQPGAGRPALPLGARQPARVGHLPGGARRLEARSEPPVMRPAERFFSDGDYWKSWSEVPDVTVDIDYALRAVRHDDRSVLDVPCGRGRLLKAVSRRAPGAALYGVDVNGQMVEQSR